MHFVDIYILWISKQQPKITTKRVQKYANQHGIPLSSYLERRLLRLEKKGLIKRTKIYADAFRHDKGISITPEGEKHLEKRLTIFEKSRKAPRESNDQLSRIVSKDLKLSGEDWVVLSEELGGFLYSEFEEYFEDEEVIPKLKTVVKGICQKFATFCSIPLSL